MRLVPGIPLKEGFRLGAYPKDTVGHLYESSIQMLTWHLVVLPLKEEPTSSS
jgi:hypothetical protein